MDVHLLIHLERADRDVVWWAETDDVAGFSAAADSLAEMRARALAALAEIAEEQGHALGRVTEQLVGSAPPVSATPAPTGQVGDRPAPTYVCV